MFTNEEAQALIGTKKVLENPFQIIDLAKEKNRLDLLAPDEPDYKFFIDITSNQRIQFKISIHHQEKYSNIGLVRVDYKGRHLNPEGIKDTLPEIFKQYAGAFFERTEPHIHFYVDGYKPLAWAIPLKDYDFDTQSVKSMEDFNNAICNFAKLINVETILNIQQAIL